MQKLKMAIINVNNFLDTSFRKNVSLFSFIQSKLNKVFLAASIFASF